MKVGMVFMPARLDMAGATVARGKQAMPISILITGKKDGTFFQITVTSGLPNPPNWLKTGIYY